MENTERRGQTATGKVFRLWCGAGMRERRQGRREDWVGRVSEVGATLTESQPKLQSKDHPPGQPAGQNCLGATAPQPHSIIDTGDPGRVCPQFKSCNSPRKCRSGSRFKFSHIDNHNPYAWSG